MLRRISMEFPDTHPYANLLNVIANAEIIEILASSPWNLEICCWRHSLGPSRALGLSELGFQVLQVEFWSGWFLRFCIDCVIFDCSDGIATAQIRYQKRNRRIQCGTVWYSTYKFQLWSVSGDSWCHSRYSLSAVKLLPVKMCSNGTTVEPPGFN